MDSETQEQIHELVVKAWLVVARAQDDGVDVPLRDIVDGMVRVWEEEEGPHLLEGTKHELMITGLATYIAQYGDDMATAAGVEPERVSQWLR
jgi:hypothetical protein